MTDAPSEAAVDAAHAARNAPDVPEEALQGTCVGECPNCGTRFTYGRGGEREVFDQCLECGSREWGKWGVEIDGERIPREAYEDDD